MRNEKATIGTIILCLCTALACGSESGSNTDRDEAGSSSGRSGGVSNSGQSGQREGPSGAVSPDAQVSRSGAQSGRSASTSGSAPPVDSSNPARDAAQDTRVTADGSRADVDAGDARDAEQTADAGPVDSSIADCNVEPVTPGATRQTRNVLCYLYSIVGKKILSAQEEDNSDEAMDYIFSHTGKYPAIRAFDFNNSKAPDQCVNHAKKGGLCMFGYHMGINGQKYDVPVNMDRVVTPGTAENQSLNQRLDDVAAAFKKLQEVDGVGIVRLFHEAGNGCSWFWWTKGTSQQYNTLWKYAFRYLTGTKGLKNTLWLVPHCGNRNSGAWNPGKEYVDIGGSDTYKSKGDYQPLTAQFNDTQATFPGLPIALHENGPIPDPDLLISTKTQWVLFNTWSDHFDTSNNSVEHTKKVYSHPYVITLDELPSFR